MNFQTIKVGLPPTRCHRPSIGFKPAPVAVAVGRIFAVTAAIGLYGAGSLSFLRLPTRLSYRFSTFMSDRPRQGPGRLRDHFGRAGRHPALVWRIRTTREYGHDVRPDWGRVQRGLPGHRIDLGQADLEKPGGPGMRA